MGHERFRRLFDPDYNPTRPNRLEKDYMSSIIIYQHGDDIHVSKNRHSGLTGFVSPAQAIELILTDFAYSETEIECIDPLKITNVDFFDIIIMKKIKEAIKKVLLEDHLDADPILKKWGFR